MSLIIKKEILIIFLIKYIYVFVFLEEKYYILRENYSKIQKNFDLHFNKNIKDFIKLGIYTTSLSDGGLQRITSILVNYLEKINIIKIFLFTMKEKESNEYKISNNIKRIVIKDTNNVKYLIAKLKKNKIDILIYQFPNQKEIKELNNLKNVQVIFYIHSSFLYWFYAKYLKVLNVYKEYTNSKYIISLIPLEHFYIFRKWGINSILFDNFLTYDYKSTIPSDLSKNEIIMIGRAKSQLKRFELGIQAIEYIKNKIKNIKLIIISKHDGIDYIEKLVDNLNLNLGSYIEFANYSSDPSIYFKSSSLHFLTSACECYPMVLTETKIFGIPTILMGLDYVSLSKNGTVIIYDDFPETLAKISLKLLLNRIYLKKLSNEARTSMHSLSNENLFEKWKKLLLLVYNDYKNYTNYFDKNYSNKTEYHEILQRQISLLKNRNKDLQFINISFIENLSNITLNQSLLKK